MPDAVRVLRIDARPDLVPAVARLLWDEFESWRTSGYALDQVAAVVAAGVADRGVPQTFVLLAGDALAGTASLAAQDLDERPDLGPWLAGVLVVPAYRGQGYAMRLVTAVEAAARRAGIGTLWLYTSTAEGLYQKAGWVAAERFAHHGRASVLMHRAL